MYWQKNSNKPTSVRFEHLYQDGLFVKNDEMLV